MQPCGIMIGEPDVLMGDKNDLPPIKCYAFPLRFSPEAVIVPRNAQGFSERRIDIDRLGVDRDGFAQSNNSAEM